MKDTGKQVWVPLQLFPSCRHSMCWWQFHVFLVSSETMIFLFLNIIWIPWEFHVLYFYCIHLSSHPHFLLCVLFLNSPSSLIIFNNPSCASYTLLSVGPPTEVHCSVLDLLGTSLSLLEKPSAAHSFSPRFGDLWTPSPSVLECWWCDHVVVCRQPQRLWAYKCRSHCPENAALLWFFLTSGAFSLSVPCSEGGCAIDAPFVAGNSTDTYSLHFDQLWISA